MLSLSFSFSVCFFLLPLRLFLSFLVLNVHFSVCAAWPFLEADLLTLAVVGKSVARCRPLLELRWLYKQIYSSCADCGVFLMMRRWRNNAA